MPRARPHRNPLGNIYEHTVVKGGKTITVFDVRKRFTDESGKAKAKTQRCYSYAEALAALGSLPARVEDGQHAPERTFGELLDYFKKEYCQPAVFVGDEQISGYRQRVSIIKAYLEEYRAYFGSKTELSLISYETLRQFATHLATSPIKAGNGYKTAPDRLPSPATVNRKLSYLRRVLNVGKQLRWVAVNPFTEGKALIKQTAERPRTRVLTYEEEKRLLSWCVDERAHLRLIVILAIDTGLRKKEIFGLRRGDIDMDAHLIRLPVKSTKALRARAIVISERLEAELRKHFDNFSFHPNAPIFFGIKDADRAFATACRLAGIEGLHFHDLRHTATTWMDEADISQPVKQNMVGHADDRTHQRYHNLSEDIVASVRSKMKRFDRRKSA